MTRRRASTVVRSGSLVLAAGLCAAPLAGAPDPYTSESESSPVTDYYQQEKNQRLAREQQELYRLRVSIPDAVRQDVPNATALRRDAQPATTSVTSDAWREAKWTIIGCLVACFLAVGLILRRFANGLLTALNSAFNPLVVWSVRAESLPTLVRAEEASLREFLTAFHAGPDLAEGASGDASVRAAAVKAFHEKAIRTLDTQSQLLREIDRTSDEGGRQKMLAALRWELHALRSQAGVPELLPVWQLAFAVEGLLKQLTDNAGNVTPSTLRTLGGGVELLRDLCQSGVAPDLLTRQPLRLLAVDDDAISRKAVSLALKRALNEPELAEDGEAALALATRHVYDVIFLDVQMPGLDGFEVCCLIHQTETNRNTPVVFVTGHSDFEARAKSTLSGGSDLIGKPFLTFEITVKALTLALRGRLATCAAKTQVTETQSPAPHARPASEAVDVSVAPAAATDCAQASQSFAGGGSSVALTAESREVTKVFLARASAHLAPLRESIQAMLQASDETTRQDLLADVFLRIHSFTPKMGLPALHPALQMSAALEALLRKLLASPQSAPGSTLFTLATGVQLLDELCSVNIGLDLLRNPPIRLLVVDDDPIARRALTGALQMAYKKPESAESGEAALALAVERQYDVIFLDVQMPGMDGLEACAKIRQTTMNRTTPVVFVTGHIDVETRARITACGGSDLVGKPFLTSEITLKALTFVLRSRLDKLEAEQRKTLPMPVNLN